MNSALPTIERKSLLYRSGLGFFCINHVQGCGHGCRYPCHGYLLANRHGRTTAHADWCQPRIVGNALSLLERELKSKRKLPSRVHLCLSTDPFMYGQPEIGELTLALIERLNRASIPCSVLTKGVLPLALADQSRFHRFNTYGISLVSLDEAFRRQWEPGASPYAERVAALERLHDAGCRTLVHLEPYPTPNLVVQDLLLLLSAVSFADELHFGGWNYNPKVAAYPEREEFYEASRRLVRRFSAERGIACEVW